MDLERIKQNLRLRSGRLKRQSKKQNTSIPPSTDSISQSGQPRPQTSIGYTAAQVATRSQTSAGHRNSQNTPRPQTSLGHTKSYTAPRPQTSHGGSNAQSLRPFSPSADNERRNAQLKAQGTGDNSEHIRKTRSEADKSRGNADLGTVLSDVVEGHELEIHDQKAQQREDDMSTPRESSPQIFSRTISDPNGTQTSFDSEIEDFDLRPPAPRPKPPSMESISELLFSAGHLNTLLYNSLLLKKFTVFLQKYRPEDYPLLLRYLETSKALKAIEYANAVAESAPPLPKDTKGNETETSKTAAVLDDSFRDACFSAFETLLNTSLPLYITYTLIRTISEYLVDEVTGRTSSETKNMVGGLSEVFCLADPNQNDNPIVYASEEFYRLTGYGQDNVIGSNCRFLQGPKTSQSSTKRIREALGKGEHVCETLLNYRRDGKPFVNVLMVAPLHDDKGKVRYYIGAQVDVSKLIESGRVLEGFQKYLSKREAEKAREAREKEKSKDPEMVKKQKALDVLKELSELFDLEESAVIQSHSRASSAERNEESKSPADANTRRRFVDSDASEGESDQESMMAQANWKLGPSGSSGISGKLPGIYEKYMLIRPAPSLRIVFVSPKLRKYGSIVQSPFMSHVAAPASTLSGLAESFKTGVPVSAKINFMSQRSENRNGTKIPSNERHEDGKYGRACWLSATPLQGGDSRIGVWMIVFIEKAQAKARQTKPRQSQLADTEKQRADQSNGVGKGNSTADGRNRNLPAADSKVEKHKANDLPIKPRRLDDAIHSTVNRQDSKKSATAYQYQAATPVEEYHSADEEGNPASPIEPAPRADMPPHTPTYEITDDSEFVQPTSHGPASPSQDRLRISPDSDHEGEHGSGRLQSANHDMTLGKHEEYQHQDPNKIPPSIPSDRNSSSAGEEQEFDTTTLARSASPTKDNEYNLNSTETIRQSELSPARSPPPRSSSAKSPPPEDPLARNPTKSPPPKTPPASSQKSHSPSDQWLEYGATPTSRTSYGTHASRKSGGLPAGLGYMDYLRHPGRHISSDVRRGRKKSREGDGSGSFESDGCISPYSVD